MAPSKQSDAESSLRCEVATELDVLNALRRRGIAYELAHLMSYEVHEMIVSLFFTELQRDPIEGFKKTTLGQLSAADREVHLRLAERTRAGLPMGPAGLVESSLWTSMLRRCSSSHRWMWLLMPKQKPAAPERPSAHPGPKGGNPKAAATAPDKRGQPKGGKFDKKSRRNMKNTYAFATSWRNTSRWRGQINFAMVYNFGHMP